MWLSWAAFACGGSRGQGSGDAQLETDPETIDFGTVALGESAETDITLHDAGDADLYIADLSTRPASLEVQSFVTSVIAAGDEATATLRWTPTTVAPLDGHLALVVGASLDDASEIDVPAVGSVTGAVLALSEEAVDLGTTDVGCTATAVLGLANQGTTDLVVSSIALSSGDEFTLTDEAGAALVFPLTIAPGETAGVQIAYAPTEDHGSATTIAIDSNDPIDPMATVPVTAIGRLEGAKSLEWTVQTHQGTTALIQVNAVAISGPYNSRLYDSLDTLFETLDELGGPYRIAFIATNTGAILGDIPYIDDSFTSDAAVDAAENMLAAKGDFDGSLQLLLDGIDENAEWLLDESDYWKASKLSLVGINSDIEQSPGDATHYIDEYDDYKTDPDDIVVDGIAGPDPGGCSGSGYGAEPSKNLADAAAATGGLFFSICDSDWTKHMVDLANSFEGAPEHFYLPNEPVLASIEVRVDGVQRFDGWRYDAKTSEIVFDTDTYPERGAELTVDYDVAVACK